MFYVKSAANVHPGCIQPKNCLFLGIRTLAVGPKFPPRPAGEPTRELLFDNVGGGVLRRDILLASVGVSQQ